MEKKKDCPNKLLTILMIVCVTLSVVILGIISYDKFLKKEEKRAVPNNVVPASNPSHDCDCPKCTSDKNLGEKVDSLKEIALTENNQEFKINGKVLKLRKNTNGILMINDEIIKVGEYELEPYNAYVTDKYIFATIMGQDGEHIDFAIGDNGEIVANNNSYQMMDFRINDGYLHASGHIFCGLDGDCPNKDLIIKYIDNTLIVTVAK